MEQHWDIWLAFWAVIPITLAILWICLFWKKSCDKIEDKKKNKEMVNYNIWGQGCEILMKPYSTTQHKVCLTSSESNDIEEALYTPAHGTSNFERSPPDIFIINETGKTVEYIMCV